jgi:hypothetical protein
LVVTYHNRLWCFHWKAYLKSDTMVGLTTRLPLKGYNIPVHVCLRNFNYEISVVLNLAPCTFTGCCHIIPLTGLQPKEVLTLPMTQIHSAIITQF